MAKTYTPVNWEAGTIVKQATVTIDNVEYEVNPAEVEGTTPVTAENLKHMDDAIKELYDEGTTSKDIVIGSEEEATEDTKLLIETDTFATLGTEVVNSLEGNENYLAPSVQIINKLHTYSNDEQLYGFWESTDGTKLPLYRKKISTTTPATVGSTLAIVKLPDECNILLFDGYVYDGGQRLPLNFYLGSDNYYYSYPYLNEFRMKLANENRINKDCTVILTYIKTATEGSVE